jgi:hypothetical protein
VLHRAGDYYYVRYVDINFGNFGGVVGSAASNGGSFRGGGGVRKLNRRPEDALSSLQLFFIFQSPQTNS